MLQPRLWRRVLRRDTGSIAKAIGINLFIGKRPCAAFGNFDGDREMLEYTTAGKGARFALLVLHDDGARGWAVVSMKDLPNDGRF